MVDLGGSRSIARIACVALVLAFVSCQSVNTFTDPREWGEPEIVESLGTGAQRADVAIDPMGNAIAVWDQTNPAALPPGAAPNQSDDIWSSREDDTGRWNDAELLEEEEPDDSVFAHIGIDGHGTAFVAFLHSPSAEYDEGAYRVWAVRDVPGDGGEKARCIQSSADDLECSRLDGTGDAGQPHLAVDGDGNTVVVWHQVEDESVRVRFNRFAPGSGWLGSDTVAGNDESDQLRPAVAMDAGGNALAVWERLDHGISSIHSRRLPRSGEREETQAVEFDNTGNAYAPRVAVDPAGNAVAVWVQQPTQEAPFSIWSNRYLASTGRWGDVELIGLDSADDETNPQIAMDEDGNAIAVWAQIGTAREGVWSNRYVAEVGWEGAVPIGPRNLGPARDPQIAANLFGDAVAVWVQFDRVQDRVWSNRYTANRGWSVSEAIEPDAATATTSPRGPRVALDAGGDAVAVWLAGPSEFRLDVWASRLSARAPGPDTR